MPPGQLAQTSADARPLKKARTSRSPPQQRRTHPAQLEYTLNVASQSISVYPDDLESWSEAQVLPEFASPGKGTVRTGSWCYFKSEGKTPAGHNMSAGAAGDRPGVILEIRRGSNRKGLPTAEGCVVVLVAWAALYMDPLLLKSKNGWTHCKVGETFTIESVDAIEWVISGRIRDGCIVTELRGRREKHFHLLPSAEVPFAVSAQMQDDTVDGRRGVLIASRTILQVTDNGANRRTRIGVPPGSDADAEVGTADADTNDQQSPIKIEIKPEPQSEDDDSSQDEDRLRNAMQARTKLDARQSSNDTSSGTSKILSKSDAILLAAWNLAVLLGACDPGAPICWDTSIKIGWHLVVTMSSWRM